MTLRAYLAIKFYEDCRNQELIEKISDVLKEIGIKTIVMVRDYEKWCKVRFKPEVLMKKTFDCIDKSDILIVEFSEKGVGLGIETGYAYSKGIPIIIIAKEGSEISNTMKGVAKQILFYKNPKDLKHKIKV